MNPSGNLDKILIKKTIQSFFYLKFNSRTKETQEENTFH